MPDLTQDRTILRPDQLDDVAQAVLALARERWVTIDRQLILEAVLAERGIDVAKEIDAFEPDAAMLARLAARRGQLLGAVTDALNRTRS